ncbi:MAG: hypothetical protein JEZ04_04370 [Spirochaetales bacterium]|nr:hypothetical protein [Spirochaetales bacterium]
MAYSDDYLRQLSRQKAKGVAVEPEMVRTLFSRYVSDLPTELCWDILNYFLEGSDAGQVLEIAERLSVVIDLFEGEYDEDDLKLTDEELSFISESVNDFAINLTDDMLMNVMRAAVSRRLMG